MTPKKHDYVMRLYMYITSYRNLTYFYLDVSISIRDLLVTSTRSKRQGKNMSG